MKFQAGDIIHYKDTKYIITAICKLRDDSSGAGAWVPGYVYQEVGGETTYARDQGTVDEKYTVIFADFDEGALPTKNRLVQVKDKIAREHGYVGFLVKPSYINARRPGATGRYQSWVGGCGGDVWFVKHEDDSVAVYAYNELLVAQ